MSDFLTKDKQRELLAGLPEGADKTRFISTLVDRGFELEGLNAEFDFGEAAGNIIPSAVEVGKNIYAAITSPIQTAKAIGTIGKGGLQKLVPGEQDAEKAFDSMVGFFVDRFGGKDKLLNTIEKDPAGFLLDISTVIGGAGGAVSVGTKGTRLAKIGKTARGFSRAIDPTTAIPAVVRKSAEKFNAVSRINQHAFELMENSLQINQAQAAKLARKTFGKSPGQVAAEFGIKGTPEQMAEQAQTLANMSKAAVDEGLARVEGTFNHSSVTKTLKVLEDGIGTPLSDEFLKVKDRISEFLGKVEGKTETRLIDKIVKEPSKVLGVSGQRLVTTKKVKVPQKVKRPPEGLTLSEINEVKRMLDTIDSPFGKSMDISGIGTVDFVKSGLANKDVANLRAGVQKFIEQEAGKAGFKNLNEINKRTIFGTELNKLLRDSTLSLKGKKGLMQETLFLLGIGGSIVSARLDVLAATFGVVLAKRKVLSPQFRSAMANRLLAFTDSQLNDVVRSLQTGKVTPRARGLVRQAFADVRQLFPEHIKLSTQAKGARLAGIVQQRQEGVQ